MKKLLFILSLFITSNLFAQVNTGKKLYTKVGGGVTPSDTSSMLSPYLRKTDTTGKWASPASVALKKDANDSTNATTGYTTLYQNSLKISTAVANATYATISNLALKADDDAVVKLSTNQTIAGDKTFTGKVGFGGVNTTSSPSYFTSTSDVGMIFERTGASLNSAIQYKNNNGNVYAGISQKGNGYFGISSNSDLSLGVFNLDAPNRILYLDGSFSVGSYTLPPSAVASFNSTTKGVLIPRMTTTQLNAISSPAEALNAYDLTAHKPAWWNGSSYQYPIWETDSLDANLISGEVAKKNIPVTNIHTQYPSVAINDSTIGTSTTWMDSLYALINAKADIASPAFTGTPKIGSDTLATNAYVRDNAGSGGGSSSFPSLQYRNYADDSTAIVDGGLWLWDYYRSGSQVKTVASYPWTRYLNFTVNSSAANSVIPLKLGSYESGAITAHVFWGDGSDSVININGDEVGFKHTYATAGTYHAIIRMTGQPTAHITKINFQDEDSYGHIDIADVGRLDSLPQLNSITIFSTNVTTLPTFPNSTAYINISLSNIGTFNPASIPSSLTNLQLINCGLTSFAPTAGLPASLTNLELTNNNLNSSAVDATINWLVTLTFNAGAKTLLIKQTTAAPPTAASSAARATLISDGWTLTTD